nr:hypothetical protein [Candidatus Njordarchaeota archaeon]
MSGAQIIYTLDKAMAKNVGDLQVVNPIPLETFNKYNNWLNRQMRSRRQK